MSAVLVLFLSAGACILIGSRGRRWWVPVHRRLFGLRDTSRRQMAPTSEEQPRLVRQLASLLSAGRTGPALWQAMVHVLAMELNRTAPPGGVPLSTRTSAQLQRWDVPGSPPGAAATMLRHGMLATVHPQHPPGARRDGRGAGRDGTDATLILVIAVQRASELGLPTATAIRTTCRETSGGSRLKRAAPDQGALSLDQRRLWLDIAACFEVCEASGAPVAAVLERLAGTLEAEQDAAAQRETALAGPRATVRLLTWLPLVGLGLGMLMGVDPLGVLFGSPVGWSVLAVGAVFAVAGRTWSARMIARAAGPSVLQDVN
ncbi:tight adherence protein B [Arthrobacter stackebrandtii]|uniref:Tight adherence protein B n=1 Tax=Arthrobacter stackebrandtii TaxID=272161 RepID=A0ABS4YUD0_9MICC|nr:hypothetical protein [Arthrobacter stackebrandtii]MBP2412402.1 tight adherence protein B [Arthrobacter stackebrandtii]PYH02171.1 hypothetical protein CVV67_01660 [Arthrobacter stackebrandtii]